MAIMIDSSVSHSSFRFVLLVSVVVVVVVVPFVLTTTDAFTASNFMPNKKLSSSGCDTNSISRITKKTTTELFIEDWVADMIDGELWRENHKKEFENEWMEKNRGAVLKSINKAGSDSSAGEASNLMVTEDDQEAFREKNRDRYLAARDPQRYCADRCVTTGNCDVYEDIFDMSPQQVREFCEECVLSDGDEPCDVPEAFYDMYDLANDDENNQLKP